MRLIPVLVLSAFSLSGSAGFAADASEENRTARPQEGGADVVKLSQLTVEESQTRSYASTAITQLGPLGAKALLDTPYSLNVVDSNLIENLQATVPDDVFKINPLTQITTPSSRFFTALTMRGFSTGSTRRIDGIPNTNPYNTVDIEDKERIEVITGLSGFLYGSGNVGGTINYVLKRPTEERLNRVTVGLNGGENAYVHGDFGGRLGSSGNFGYRLNVVGQDGDTNVDFQSIRRHFVSGAFDWKISPSLLLRFDASATDYKMTGTEPYWSTTAGVKYAQAPDADNYYGQPFSYTKSRQHHFGGQLSWKIADGLSLRAGGARRENALDLLVVNNTFIAGASGSYRSQVSAWEYPDVTATGGYAFLDGDFRTWKLKHTVTAGWYGDSDERTNFRSSPGGWSTLTYASGFNLAKPVYVDTPSLAPTGDKYKAQETTNHNFVIGDSLELGSDWTALVGLNYAKIDDKSFDATGAVSSPYSEGKATPTYSLLYKLRPWLSLYGSTMESFERGGTAAATYGGYPVANAYQTMAPLTSDQVEVGLKAQLGKTFATLAAFEIDKALQYYDVSTVEHPVYVQNGRQVHRGFEGMISGQIARGLTVFGGFTWLQAKIERNTQTPSLVGKQPANVAERVAKLFAEYELPFYRALAVTGGAYYTGSQFVDAANTDSLPSFVTYDLGLRHTLRLGATKLTSRLTVSNLTGENYWLNSNYVGAPRTVRASLAFDF